MSTKFTIYLQHYGIIRQLNVVRTLQQNRVLERKNQTIMNKVRLMLIDSRMSAFLWMEVAHTAVHLVNCSSAKSNQSLTPHKLLTWSQPNLSNIKKKLADNAS